MDNKEIKASDCKCCMCGKQAVAFWPVIDPDIPSEPYCRECLDKQKTETIATIFGSDKDAYKMAKYIVNSKNKELKQQIL